MQHTDKARAEFEAWWVRQQPFNKLFEDVKDQMRNVWLASREELVVELPEVEYFGDSWSGGWALRKDDVIDAIEAAGVAVRG